MAKSKELLLKAIQKKIDNSETKGWEKWASVCAFSSQLLKDRKVIYQENDNNPKKIMTGVPQGGVLSPIFFNITLDYILMETNNEIREIVEGRKMLAYADDIIIAVNQNEKSQSWSKALMSMF